MKKFIVNGKTYCCESREEAERNALSDLVYDALGGDDEFLYDEEGEPLEDNEIVDDIDEIIGLGEEADICGKDEEGYWFDNEDQVIHIIAEEV